MENIQEFIRNNREEFDKELPSLGHKERFFKRRDSILEKKRSYFINYLAAAAILAVAFVIPFYLSNNNDSKIKVAKTLPFSVETTASSSKEQLTLEEQHDQMEINDASQLLDKGLPMVSLGRSQRLWDPRN